MHRFEGRVVVHFEFRWLIALGIFAQLAVPSVCSLLHAQASPSPSAIPPAPMGWSSWNSFSNTVDSAVVARQARAMFASGLKTAGYEYINIDEGWWHGQRDEAGNIVVDAKDWPALKPGEHAGDMSNIVRYIHGLGLKAGIYTDAGTNGCGTYAPDLGPGYPHTGSEGHYEQDFTQFAKWGFDYLKIDYCGAGEENLDASHQYQEIARALARAEVATGHTMLLSICAGKSDPWMWAPNIGGLLSDIWRTGSDIVGPVVAGTPNAYMNMSCTKSCPRQASFQRVLRNFDQGIHPEAQHTGFYNDPDMMVLGMPGLTDTENRVHMSLWAMSGAPLIVGADLTMLSPASLSDLINAAVLRVDQDPLGLQAVRVAEPRTGLEVWSKKLAAPGERAILLLNRTGESSPISVDWSDLGLLGSVASRVKDLWSGKNLSASAKPIAATVPAQDAVMLLVTGQEIAPTRFVPEEVESPQTQSVATTCSNAKEFRFTHVLSRSKVTAIQILYANNDKVAHGAELRVNGQNGTRIVFPLAGEDAGGEIWIQALLDLPGAANTITVAADCGVALRIEALFLQ
jgi:hypothetical protein